MFNTEKEVQKNELLNLLDEALDYLYELKGEWHWKIEGRKWDEQEYEELCNTIQKIHTILVLNGRR